MSATPQSRSTNGEVTVAFVGSVVPDTPRFRNEAFSRAGNLFQENFLHGLADNGLPPSAALSVATMPSYPRSRRLFVGRECARLAETIELQLVPFLNVTPLKQLSVGFAIMWELFRWSWMHRNRSRVICSYNLSVPPGLFTWLAARISGSKIIALLCDINVPGQTVPDGAWYRVDFGMQRWLIPRLDGAVVVSDAIASDFAHGVPTLRMEGGIRSEVFEKPIAAQPKEASQFVIAVAGNLDTVNGIDTLLAAFRQLPSGCRLRIAGKGPLESEVRKAAAADERIEYLGFISLDRVFELYASADVLVAMRPTRSLNTRYFFPSKVLEYIASGTPVLTTATGHVEEEFGEFVYLLRDETPKGLAELLNSIRNEPSSVRAARGARGRSYIRQNKTWAAQASRIVSFIERIAGTRNVSGA